MSLSIEFVREDRSYAVYGDEFGCYAEFFVFTGPF